MGNVSDEQLTVVFPEGIRQVQDYVTGTISTLTTPVKDEQTRLIDSVKTARFQARSFMTEHPWRVPVILGNVVALLGLVTYFVHRRRS